MLVENLVEVDFRAVGLRRWSKLDRESQRVEDPQGECKLGARLTRLEFVYPLSRDAGEPCQLVLTDAKVSSTAAYYSGQSSY